MADFIFKESWERYALGAISGSLLDNILMRWTSADGIFSIVTPGRYGQALRMSQAQVSKALPHSSRWVTGFGYRRNQNTVGDESRYQIFNNNNQMCRLLEDSDATLSLRAGNSNVIAVTNRALNTGRWYDLELDVTLGGGTPITCDAELRINGKVEASGSGSTGFNSSDQLSGDATGNFHQFAGVTGFGNSADFDDIYIKNFAGYEGDARVIAAYATGDGGILQWTPNSGSTHFDRINSHPLDLTKFLSGATPGDIDLWTFVLPSFSGTIPGINISVLARKDDEGTKSFKIVFGPTGTDAQSDEFFVSDLTPEYYEFSLKTNPTTGLAFVPGDTITLGVKLIS